MQILCEDRIYSFSPLDNILFHEYAHYMCMCTDVYTWGMVLL